MEERHPIHEENAIVIDFLPNGYPSDTRPSHMKTPIVQAVGITHFVLLELVPKRDVALQPQDKVYIGEGKRDKIHHINGKLQTEKLTSTATAELKYTIERIVRDKEKDFVSFFNNAPPLSTRMHSIELIPGMGKKRMWEILDERKEKPFDSFDDIKKRVKLIPDPFNATVERIYSEITGDEKHKLFAR